MRRGAPACLQCTRRRSEVRTSGTSRTAMASRAMLYAAALAALAAPTLAQSGPFDVTTIVRLKRTWSDEGPADWGTKIRQMWPWKTQGSPQQFIPNGTVEVHARTNALGFPLRIGGGVMAAEVEDQVPECAAYGPCDDWDNDRWTREASPVTAPPIQPQRLDGDTVAVGELVRVLLTTRKNEAGGLAFGLCSEEACASMLMKGVNERFEMAYDVAIIRANDLFYGKKGEWALSGGPKNATFEEDTKHTIEGTRTSPYGMEVWHEKNRSAAIAVPLEPDRHRLKMFSGLGPTAYLHEGEDPGRLDGDLIAVGERVRVHLTNYDRVAISFGICSSESCSVVGVQGVSKDKRLDYRTWVTTDSLVRQRDNPILDSRCVSCGSRGGVAKGGTNLFVVQRRSETEMAVWLEDNPRDVVTMPLEPDRDRLKLETYFSVATFIRDAVWSASEAGAEMVSPGVGGVSDVVCVSVVYLASSRDAGLNVFARAVNGTDFPLATIRPDKANAWRFNRTVVDLPASLRRSEWRLVLSAHLPKKGSTVHLQRVGGCNHLDDEDVMIVGEASLPMYVPGYNVSWGAPRQVRAAPARWCANGGVKDDFGACICPPGFRGQTCADGCGANKYGMDCGGSCSALGDGCRGMLFCAPGLPCACAPGFKGDTCDQACDVGEYGNNCALTCPYCRDGACDPYTGQCSQDRKLLFGNECGRPPTTDALTVNGLVASVDSFPWHGAVYQRHAKQYRFTCGAALVTPSVLISAAHCFYDHNLNRVLPAERFAIALGKTRSGWDALEKGTVHKSKVSALHVPEAYRGQVSNYLGDIALVELQDPVPPGLSIATVCVDPTVTLVPEEALRVAGWGDETTALDVLEYVNMPFLPTKTCYRRASDTLIKYITADKFCSIIQSEADQRLAKGDSGGGAVVERDGVWYLQGVVSLRQGTNDYTFTNVTHADHLQWMKDTLSGVALRRG